jgi:hypothetical protein
LAATDAVFPSVPQKAGHYESFYLRAGHPSEALAVWIRHTVHKPPGAAARGSVWFTLFDPASGPPRASKVTGDDLAAGDGCLIRIGDSRFEARRAVGAALSDPLAASWSLELEPRDGPFEHLPRAWMYTATLPRTKALSPCPSALFRGQVTVDGRTIDVDGWPGMVGHNWGAEHAERWVWLHGVAFDGAPDAWLDATFGRIKVGPVTVPWIANACLSLSGRRYRLGGLERALSTHVDARPGTFEFRLAGSDASVRGRVEADLGNTVAWVYADPAGGEHQVLNCSAASLELAVECDGQPASTLRTRAGASYELGIRERDHGVAVQPFGDG